MRDLLPNAPTLSSPFSGRQREKLLTEPIEKCGESNVRWQPREQSLRNVHGDLAGARDDRLLRRSSVSRDSRFGLAAKLCDLLRRLCEQIGLLDLR